MAASRASLILKRLAATAGALAAVVVAVNAFFGGLTTSIHWVYCTVLDCTPPPPPLPTVKTLRAPDMDGKDGGGNKSGHMRDIQVSITNNPPGEQDRFNASWVWTGSGGTQHGSQNVIIDMLTKDGGKVFTYSSPINRDHCYYGAGNPEAKQGVIDGEAGLVDAIAVRITEVIGSQGGC